MASVLAEFRVLIAPGLHNSGPDHWQSRWQRLFPAFERVQQDDWEMPDLARWSDRVDDVRRRDRHKPTLIVAHSFGALASVHSLAGDAHGVAGVLLVAPADPDKFRVAALLPQQALPVPSIMVGSTNDPWMAAPRAQLWAQRWHSRFINGGPLGHINAESGLGDWPEGLETLYFLAEQAHNGALST
ncbi:RBBP9/YdeN family alpha/beta hydrolase [Duganella callida]|uniref:Alpha/beta hydrolase n=1 Tax=Duganella callida TaxID=2561932 RepID=A0A4Y9S386_9BURK|nr:alpha/beta hydrolase [Duganella callida]TFW14941.1 alpha/beta hydrolase [Duganella callida]